MRKIQQQCHCEYTKNTNKHTHTCTYMNGNTYAKKARSNQNATNIVELFKQRQTTIASGEKQATTKTNKRGVKVKSWQLRVWFVAEGCGAGNADDVKLLLKLAKKWRESNKRMKNNVNASS